MYRGRWVMPVLTLDIFMSETRHHAALIVEILLP